MLYTTLRSYTAALTGEEQMEDSKGQPNQSESKLKLNKVTVRNLSQSVSNDLQLADPDVDLRPAATCNSHVSCCC